MDEVIGFKGFGPDLTCLGKQYRIGGKYWIKVKPKLCEHGFHFCLDIEDVLKWYRIFSAPDAAFNRFALVRAHGDIIIDKDERKCVCSKLEILREIHIADIERVLNCGSAIGSNHGLFNDGIGNTGLYNIGSYNTGNENVGSRNSGIANIGDFNSGTFNIGEHNSGMFNQASYCSGAFNTIDRASGMFNKDCDYTKMPQWIKYMAFIIPYGQRTVQITPRKGYDRLKWLDDRNMRKYEISSRPYRKIFRNAARHAISYLNHTEAINIILHTELMPNFDWGIFTDITGITRDWLSACVAGELGNKEE